MIFCVFEIPLAVMEIMYHSTLRASPLRPKWWTTFPELYSFLGKSTKPVFDITNNNDQFMHKLSAENHLSVTYLPYSFKWRMSKSIGLAASCLFSECNE